MPNDESSARVLRYDSQISARQILRKKKSEVTIKAAHWMNIYHGQSRIAELERKVSDIEQARRDILIVAVTGITACIGSWVITSLLARSASTAYVTGSAAAPVYPMTFQAVAAGARTVTVAKTAVLGQTARQWVAAQIVQTILLRVPTSILLRGTLGASALTCFYEMLAGKLGKVKFSDEEFQTTRAALVRGNVGEKRYRDVLTNPSARQEQVVKALSALLQQMVAGHIVEALMGTPPLIRSLLLMNDTEIAAWSRKFKVDIDAHLDEKFASWSPEDKAILRNNLHWHFWNDVKNQLNSAERRWDDEIRLLQRTIHTELFGGLLMRVGAR